MTVRTVTVDAMIAINKPADARNAIERVAIGLCLIELGLGAADLRFRRLQRHILGVELRLGLGERGELREVPSPTFFTRF